MFLRTTPEKRVNFVCGRYNSNDDDTEEYNEVGQQQGLRATDPEGVSSFSI